MTNLTHDHARELIQQAHLLDADRQSLRRHLAGCEECRGFAAAHVHLLQHLPLAGARQRPTAQQRRAILAAAQTAPRPGPARWFLSLAGAAALVVLTIAFWLLMRAATTTEPALPDSLSTLLAPFLSSPTPAVTAAPAITPTPAVARTPDPRGRYIIDTVPAPSLAGNVIGEPLEQQVVVYLPPSYDGGDRRYPVVYALIWTYAEQSQEGQMHQIGWTVRPAINLALGGGETREMIVVAVDSVNALSLTNYFVNSPATGDWESFLARDLVGYIDTHYRTLPAAESRGLYGEESHGLGALAAAMNHSDVFGAVYLRKPFILTAGALGQQFVSDATRPLVIDFIDEARAWPANEAAARMQALFASHVPSTFRETVSYALAFAPDVEGGPPFFDYPFVADSSAPRDDVWQTWADGVGDVATKLRPRAQALGALHISVTSWKDRATDPSIENLPEQLAALGIPRSARANDMVSMEELGKEAFPFFSQTLVSD